MTAMTLCRPHRAWIALSVLAASMFIVLTMTTSRPAVALICSIDAGEDKETTEKTCKTVNRDNQAIVFNVRCFERPGALEEIAGLLAALQADGRLDPVNAAFLAEIKKKSAEDVLLGAIAAGNPNPFGGQSVSKEARAELEAIDPKGSIEQLDTLSREARRAVPNNNLVEGLSEDGLLNVIVGKYGDVDAEAKVVLEPGQSKAVVFDNCFPELDPPFNLDVFAEKIQEAIRARGR